MKRFIVTYLLLLFGAFLQGMAMSLFLFPHSIPSGGAAGIAILVNHWFQLPLGFSLWLANVVFLVFAVQYFGYTWTFRTIISVATTSTTITLLSANLPIPDMHVALSVLGGSIIFGIGVGILIRVGSSSGGMVIPALIIATYKNWSPGKAMMWLNFIIFSFTALVIDFKIVLYAVICQFLSTHMIDIIYRLEFYKIGQLAFNWRRK